MRVFSYVSYVLEKPWNARVALSTTSSHVPASRYFQPYERTLRRGSFGAYKLVHGMLVWVRERERASKRDREREKERETDRERERERN